jgi:hypothetical protein
VRRELLRTPGLSFEDLTARADGATDVSSAWLFRTRNRRAQDLRLKRRIERDAFVHNDSLTGAGWDSRSSGSFPR